jgi:hypothetical protein
VSESPSFVVDVERERERASCMDYDKRGNGIIHLLVEVMREGFKLFVHLFFLCGKHSPPSQEIRRLLQSDIGQISYSSLNLLLPIMYEDIQSLTILDNDRRIHRHEV